jgi:hypothetical protein
MSIRGKINDELNSLKLLPLVQEQIQCLNDSSRLDEAADMLADLRDRCGVRLPLPRGTPLGGPHEHEGDALRRARLHCADFEVVVVDRMATDESRSTGIGDEYYITGYTGPDAAVALAMRDQWVACWVRGDEHTPED